MIKKTKEFCTPRRLYWALAGAHGMAGFATGKPEVYLPMAALYALAAWAKG